MNMDIWVVAAAAGAGYIAQHWKDLLKSRHDFSESSLKSPSFLRTDSLPRMQEVLDSNCSSPVETPRMKLGERNDQKVASTSSLAGENLGMSCGSICDDINEPGYESLLPQSTTELAFCYGGNARRKSSLRSRRKIGHLIKPLNCLESCLMAQLYKEHGEVEDYIFSSNSSPWTPAVRPFVVTDGSRIINRGTSNSLSTSRGAGHHKLQDNFSKLNTVFGVPQLPSVGSMELQGKAKVKDHSGRFGDFIKMNNERHGSLQGNFFRWTLIL